MKKSMVWGVAALFAIGLAANVLAAGAKAYQVTGPVVEITDAKIVVQKGEGEKWELNRTADTKGADGVKVGDKVTIKYTMTATVIENKTVGEAATEEKAAKKAEPKAAK